MSLTGQFRNDLGSEKDSEKQIGSKYVVEVQYLSNDSNITAWEKNDNDIRGWTPRFKRDFNRSEYENQYEACKLSYGRITSVSAMKEELDEYGANSDIDPEIRKG